MYGLVGFPIQEFITINALPHNLLNYGYFIIIFFIKKTAYFVCREEIHFFL